MKTPLGVAKIEGDADGISSISILNTEEPISTDIPEFLEDAVYQMQEYFEGKRTEFSLTLNPQGTEFQKRVWKALLQIPYGKTCSYLELSQQFHTSRRE